MPTTSKDLEMQVTLLTREVRDFIATQKEINSDQKKLNEDNQRSWQEAANILSNLNTQLKGEVELLNEKLGSVKERVNIFNSLLLLVSGALGTLGAWLGVSRK